MRLITCCILLFPSLFSSVQAQNQTEGTNSENVQLLFWNVENLFDTRDDSLTRDDEYVPYSMRAWKYERYTRKLHHVYKTLVAMGGWQMPDVVCLAEVENRRVLEDLLSETPLLRHGYRIVHRDSEDRRGIDLAVLYREQQITLLDSTFISLHFPGEDYKKTRDILYLKFIPEAGDTLHLFVNHWPSRYGGGRATAGYRAYAAAQLHRQVARIYDADADAKVIVTGDFNDEPDDPSLKIMSPGASFLRLISGQSFRGTHKHQGKWSHFDQLWVSPALLPASGKGKTYVEQGEAIIFHPDFLLERDKTYGGVKPYRTYAGFRYLGGFSDHLPVFIRLSTTRIKQLEQARK